MNNISTDIYAFVSDNVEITRRAMYDQGFHVNDDNIMRQVRFQTRETHDRVKLDLGFMVIHITETDFAVSNIGRFDLSNILKISTRGPQ